MQIIGKTSGDMDSLAKTSRLRFSLKSVFDFIKQQHQHQHHRHHQQQQQEKRKEKKKNKQKKKKKNKNRPAVPSVYKQLASTESTCGEKGRGTVGVNSMTTLKSPECMCVGYGMKQLREPQLQPR